MEVIKRNILQRSVRLGGDRTIRSRVQPPPAGHSALTRRNFLAGAGASMAAGAGTLLVSAPAEARTSAPCRPGAPRPIPGEDPALAGLGLHVFLPEPGKEPSTIFDFAGRVAICDVIGDGTRTENGTQEQVAFRADMRFMEGTYVGLDGAVHQNTFGFI